MKEDRDLPKENNSQEKFDENIKKKQLDRHTQDQKGQFMTTDQGVRINDIDNSLTAGDRGLL